MNKALEDVRKHLLTGVSYVIPFIATGGILIAFAIAFAPMGEGGPDFSNAPTLETILNIGVAAFSLFGAVLGGYIAFSQAGRPGLVPGMIGGYIATQVEVGDEGAKAGFLGALVAGLIAGWLVSKIKDVSVPKVIEPLMPILIIPIISSLIIGVLMLKIIGVPIAALMSFLTDWLEVMGTGNAIVLAAILGAMIAFDMGGPVNKAAFFFGAAMISEGQPQIMGAVAAAICVPPLGLGLATKLAKSRWTSQEREAGSAALAMGMIGITEGAIPFAAADPLRVIPTICAGSAIASVVAMLSGVADHAPHGGPIVLPVVDNKLMYIVAILAGVVFTAAVINLLKSRVEEEKAPEVAANTVAQES